MAMTDSPEEVPVRADGGTDTDRDVEMGPVALSHIGHTVPDIEAAVEWYQEVLGFSLIAEPATVPAGSGHFADLFEDIVGDFSEAKLAHMETADGTGFELFEYEGTDQDNARKQEESENWQQQPGIHHFAIQHSDVEGLAARIVEHGGEQHSKIWKMFPDQKYELVYMTDPWDNFIEIYSHSYAHFFANQD